LKVNLLYKILGKIIYSLIDVDVDTNIGKNKVE